MNDSTIIKAISKVHSIIIDLLIFMFITLFTIYFTLHIGLKLDTFVLPGLKIEQLYIKWDEKIDVNIDSIKITKSNTKSEFDYKGLDATKMLERFRVLDSFFSEVNIKNIQVNDINATFRYKENHAGFLKVNGPTLSMLANIDMSDHLILFSVKEFTETATKTTLTADILADTHEQLIYGDIKVNIADIMPLHIALLADKEKVQLRGTASEVIRKSLDPIVNMIDMHPAIKPWISEYVEGEALYLEYFKGTLLYDNPISFLDTLDVKAHYDNVEYTFAPGFAPAIASRVDLSFKSRILYIYLHDATFYGQPGGKTWVTIDFKTPTNPLLIAYADLTARLTPKIVAWLKGYKIQLPFYQTKGKTTVKMAVSVTLGEITVAAKGYLKTKKATFNFSNTDILVKDAYVKIHNTDVDISKLNVTLLNNALNADVIGQFDPVSEKGHFDVSLNHLIFGKDENVLALDTKQGKLKFTYILEPKKDRLIFPKSYWKFKDHSISVNSLTAPFTFTSLSGTMPTTLITAEDRAKAYVTGSFDIKKVATDLTIDILKLQTPTVSLEQTHTLIQVTYNKGLVVKALKSSHWKIDGNKYTFKPSSLSYKNSLLTINNAHVSISNMLDSKIEGSYDFNDGNGKLILKELHAQTGDKTFLDIHKDIKIYIQKDRNEHFLEVPIFNIKFKSYPSGWDMNIKNFKLLSTYSPLLQEYNISTGSIYVSSKKSQKKIKIYGSVHYPYKILVKDNNPVETVNFNGAYQDKTLNIFLNNNINVQMKNNRLKIKAEKIGINLFAVLDYIRDHPSSESNTSKSNFEVDVQASKSYIYINKDRRALADKLLLQYKNKRVNAQLLHGKNGGAFLEYKEKQFFIYGDHFNDKFMDGLAEFSDFKGGEFSFYLTGKKDKIEGVVKITDTIIKGYKSLNNIFALLNTIPALVTFSVPHYTTNGMNVNEAYASFTLVDDVLNFPGFHVTSDELAFNGRGDVNIKNKTQDVELSLVTEASTNLSKIPLLGYILVGKKDNTETTTMTMTGPLEDPIVKSTLAKDIGVGTFNILLRTLTFPVHYIDKAQKAIKKADKK